MSHTIQHPKFAVAAFDGCSVSFVEKRSHLVSYVGLPFVVGSDYVVWDRRAQLRERKMWSGIASEGRGRGDADSRAGSRSVD
jgi:hypothetical protein